MSPVAVTTTLLWHVASYNFDRSLTPQQCHDEMLTVYFSCTPSVGTLENWYRTFQSMEKEKPIRDKRFTEEELQRALNVETKIPLDPGYGSPVPKSYAAPTVPPSPLDSDFGRVVVSKTREAPTVERSLETSASSELQNGQPLISSARKWYCKECGVYNDTWDDKCIECKQHRSGRKSPIGGEDSTLQTPSFTPAKPGDCWHCSKCKLDNEKNKRTCRKCYERKE